MKRYGSPQNGSLPSFLDAVVPPFTPGSTLSKPRTKIPLQYKTILHHFSISLTIFYHSSPGFCGFSFLHQISANLFSPIFGGISPSQGYTAAMEALHTVYGESLFGYHGFSREEVALLLASAQFVSLVFGSFLGFISGFIGYKRASLLCCILYIFGSVAKQSSNYYWFLMGLSSVAVASFLFSCTSETWMAAEHEKLGFRHEWLSDTFWKMSYNGAASALGSAALANVLVKGTIHQRMTLPLMACSVAAALCAFLIGRGSEESFTNLKIKTSRVFTFSQYMADRRLLLLLWVQACGNFANTTFWLLWTPTIVADGREVNVNLIYPCLMGSIMLGSLVVSSLLCGPYILRPEIYLTTTFLTASFSLAIAANDYQEVGVLTTLFCLFCFTMGIILPSLAKLRSIYVPCDMRAGLISVSHIPSSIAIIFVLTKGGFYHTMENSTILTISTLCLCSAAICTYYLNRLYSVANDKVSLERP